MNFFVRIECIAKIALILAEKGHTTILYGTDPKLLFEASKNFTKISRVLNCYYLTIIIFLALLQ